MSLIPERQRQADLGQFQVSRDYKVRPWPKIEKKRSLYKYELFSNHRYHQEHSGILGTWPAGWLGGGGRMRQTQQLFSPVTEEGGEAARRLRQCFVFCCLPLSANSVGHKTQLELLH